MKKMMLLTLMALLGSAFVGACNSHNEPARATVTPDKFSVSLDSTQDLPALIAAGKYDWVDREITTENFPVVSNGRVDVQLYLINFDRSVTTEEAINQIKSAGYEPANIEYLLAFGAKYPEKQREFPIVALGSVWAHSDGGRRVPRLRESSGQRRLGLGWGDPVDSWAGGFRFLVVSK